MKITKYITSIKKKFLYFGKRVYKVLYKSLGSLFGILLFNLFMYIKRGNWKFNESWIIIFLSLLCLFVGNCAHKMKPLIRLLYIIICLIPIIIVIILVIVNPEKSLYLYLTILLHTILIMIWSYHVDKKRDK